MAECDGWKAGEEVVITTTGQQNESDTRKIASIDGDCNIELDSSVVGNYSGGMVEEAGFEIRAEVLNLERYVVAFI